MTNPTSSKRPGADIATSVPTQRIVTGEAVRRPESGRHAGPRATDAPAAGGPAAGGPGGTDPLADDPVGAGPAASGPVGSGTVEADRGRADGPAAEAAGVTPGDLPTGLPDLSAVLSTVPGGLGAEVGESFTYAGQRWTAADAKVSGTPIGLQLAMEQRGLDTSSTEFEVPLQRARR